MSNHPLAVVARRSIVVFLVTVALGVAAPARAAQVGPGTDIPNDEVDTPGSIGRINVDQGSPLMLPAGIYIATTFSFDAGQSGEVTPFLAVSADGSDPTDLYTAVAVGARIDVPGPLTDQTVPFGGSAVFTLTTPRTVYAGITSENTQNPIFLDNGTGQNTDHEGVGQGGYTVTVGGQVPPDGTFSNPQLGRTYAFSINVEVIPEPSAGALVGAAVAVCGLRRRRRK